MDDYQLRPIEESEYSAFSMALSTAFGHDPDPEEQKLERELDDLARTLAAVHERDGVVGTSLSHRRQLAVPGGTLPATHVTGVSVAATHRRRGLMRGMLRRLLADRAASDEPVAVLWASEEAIYGRFGFGPASSSLRYEIDTRTVGVPAPPPGGTVREVPFTESTDTLAAVFDACHGARPGVSGRSAAHWRLWRADLPDSRQNRTKMRMFVHEGSDGPDGYALFRIERGHSPHGIANTVHVEELIAADVAGYHRLWAVLCDIDLARRLHYPFAATDEPLRYLVADPRALAPRQGGGLWLRMLDVPAALSARRYATDVDLVLEVTDDLLTGNAGRWRLAGGPAGAECTRTDAAADLSLGVAELGAAYLGGTPLAALAAAGRVRELTPGAVPAASAALGWHRAPLSIEVF